MLRITTSNFYIPSKIHEYILAVTKTKQSVNLKRSANGCAFSITLNDVAYVVYDGHLKFDFTKLNNKKLRDFVICSAMTYWSARMGKDYSFLENCMYHRIFFAAHGIYLPHKARGRYFCMRVNETST